MSWLAFGCVGVFLEEKVNAMFFRLCFISSPSAVAVSSPEYEEVRCRTRRRISAGMVRSFLLLQK